jgi:putative PIN family toxin of toxin-antitoxin system
MKAFCVVLDTNILLSALINPHGVPAELIVSWRKHRFTLLTSVEQLVELGDVARRPVLRARIVPSRVGRFIRDLGRFAEPVGRLPQLDLSPDAAGSFLLAMAQAGKSEYLASGDRRAVLALKNHGITRIVTARALLTVLQGAQNHRALKPKRKK